MLLPANAGFDRLKIYMLQTPVWAAACILFLWPALSGPVARAEQGPAKGTAYSAELKGVEDKQLHDLLIAVSDTFTYVDRPPASLFLLKARVSRDMDKWRLALRSYGYFQPVIKTSMDEQADPVRIVVTVDPGPEFILDRVGIVIDSDEPRERAHKPNPDEIGLHPGRRFMAGEVKDARQNLYTWLGQRGRPFVKVKAVRVVADHATRKVTVEYRVDPGPAGVFGPVQVTGLKTVKPSVVLSRVPWKEGEPFNTRKILEARGAIIKTGLFSTAVITPGRPDDRGVLPMEIAVTERKHRTVQVGLGYQTDTGPEVRFQWENRNAFGYGDKLRFTAGGNQVSREFGLDFRKPGFLSPAQDLIIKASVTDDFTDAYRSRSYDTSAVIERRLSDQMAVGLGVRYRLARVEDNEATYGLVSLPLYFKLDFSNDLLDPTRGGRLSVGVAPYRDILGRNVDFLKYRASYSHYLELLSKKRLVGAVRVAAGRLEGVAREILPQDELFYVGGGGSVRGYAYQTAGDLSGGDPVGGLSYMEVSAEARVRINERIGVVAFVDGGRAYAGESPDPEEDLFWGAGLGGRVYTPIGPVRLDVAVPLNPRYGVDRGYQVYISLGQSF